MTSAIVGHMQRTQRRRLMAAMMAEAIIEGRVDPDSIDLSALLFGEPELWERSAQHAVRAVSAAEAEPTEIAQERFAWDQRRRAKAGKALEDDIVKRLGIEAAQQRDGKGKTGGDTEYRRVRSKLPPYVQYLAEREVYRSLNRALLKRYAAMSPSTADAEALSAKFALPLSDVEQVREEVEALLAISTTPVGEQLAPSAAKIAGRRGLVLLDTKLRPRWNSSATIGNGQKNRPVGSPSEGPTASRRDLNADRPTRPAPGSKGDNEEDRAILHSRLGIEPVDSSLLPPYWRTVPMDLSNGPQSCPPIGVQC